MRRKPIAGGPLERYIGLLEDRVTTSEARMEEMREAHREELQELEEELEASTFLLFFYLFSTLRNINRKRVN